MLVKAMGKKPIKEKFYSLQEVARVLRVSDRSVFRYIHTGRLRATKIGYWRISETNLKTFLGENENIYYAGIKRQKIFPYGTRPKRNKRKK